jgi:hypothetical protein
MRFNKKGDLAISTNAIVVLIIAVIMLGLIIGFVTKGFGSVSDKFFGEVEKLPEPQTPSASRPITTSELTLAQQGEEFGMKIAIFNAGADASNVKPIITCGDPDRGVIAANSEQANAEPTLASKSSKTFLYVARIADDAPVGKQLCKVSAVNIADISADIVIEVRE